MGFVLEIWLRQFNLILLQVKLQFVTFQIFITIFFRKYIMLYNFGMKLYRWLNIVYSLNFITSKIKIL